MRIGRKINDFNLFASFVFRVEPDPVGAMISALVEPIPMVTGYTDYVTWKNKFEQFKSSH